MRYFLNACEQDEKYIKESAIAFMRRELYPRYIVIEDIILIALGCIMIIIYPSLFTVSFAIFTSAGVLISFFITHILLYIGIKKIRKKERKMGSLPKINIEITDSDCVMCEEGGNPYTFSLSDVRDHFESENYFYLVFNGLNYITVSKSGFLEGTAEQYGYYVERLPIGEGSKNTLLHSKFKIFLILLDVFFLIFIIRGLLNNILP